MFEDFSDTDLHVLIGRVVVSMQLMSDEQKAAFINVVQTLFREHE